MVASSLDAATTTTGAAVTCVREFWRLMATNDFAAVAAVLDHDFVLEWPQTRERIHGVANFVLMNQQYPASGAWRFAINRLVGSDAEAVSDVSITDGTQRARAISFFSVEKNKIMRVVEFWPEPYVASADRAHLIEKMEDEFFAE